MSIDVRALNQLDPVLVATGAPAAVVLSSPTALRERAKPGQWEHAYFDALMRGFSKKSAAALAGIDPSTPVKRVERGDAEFEAQEEIAYNLGLAVLESDAHDLIRHKHKPDGRVLIHLLACRGLNPKHIVETSGPNGGPQQVEVNGGGSGSLNIDAMAIPVDVKRAVVERMNEIEVMLAPYRQGGENAIHDGSNGSTGAAVSTAMVQQSPRLASPVINVAGAGVRPLVRLPI